MKKIELVQIKDFDEDFKLQWNNNLNDDMISGWECTCRDDSWNDEGSIIIINDNQFGVNFEKKYFKPLIDMNTNESRDNIPQTGEQHVHVQTLYGMTARQIVQYVSDYTEGMVVITRSLKNKKGIVKDALEALENYDTASALEIQEKLQATTGRDLTPEETAAVENVDYAPDFSPSINISEYTRKEIREFADDNNVYVGGFFTSTRKMKQRLRKRLGERGWSVTDVL